MKKIIFITLSICLMMLIGACTSKKEYKFEGLNTRMVIPEAWAKDVLIVKSVMPDDGCTAQYNAIFIGKSEKENEFLGAIYVFAPSQWAVVEDEWKGIYVKVGEVGGNLYFYKSNQSNPYGTECEIGNEYETHVIQMPDAERLIEIEK